MDSQSPQTLPEDDKLGGTWLPVLLADRSPCLRWLVLTQLMRRSSDDPEVASLAGLRQEDRLLVALRETQETDGSWDGARIGVMGDRRKSTAQAMMRLGYLGLGPDNDMVQRGADYLYRQQEQDGSWPLPGESQGDDQEREGYSMMPLQTAFALLALAMCGLAQDPHSELAYTWLLSQRLEDGAWPTGIAAGSLGYVAGYRRIAHSRWGCRSNTTGALLCLAHHPTRRNGAPARRALDLLLGRETREASNLGFEVARLIGAESTRGFLTHFARFDAGLMLEASWRIGADMGDPRVADLASFVIDQRGPWGLWTYAARPQASRWVSFSLLRSLSRLQSDTGWASQEPRTPFQPYPGRQRRH